MEFVSVLSKDIRNIFGPPPTKISKTVNDGTSSEDSILPSSDSFGDSSTSSHADRGLALTEKDDNTECILSQLQALHLKIDRLEKQDTRNNIIVNTTDLASVLRSKNVIEILVNCRSVEIILSLLPFFTIKNDLDAKGLYCGVCEYTLKYDFSLGLSFELEENLLASFRIQRNQSRGMYSQVDT